jgi:hypothetical protein
MFDAHSSMSVQSYPFPLNPELQAHVKDDKELVQVAMAEQLWPFAQKFTEHEKPPGWFTQADPRGQL